MAIQSFLSRDVEVFFLTGEVTRNCGWRNVAKVVTRKLDMLDYAEQLDDLRSPPGNRLEALKGSWDGWWSIRVNDQWRMVFKWSQQGPLIVGVIDYH